MTHPELFSNDRRRRWPAESKLVALSDLITRLSECRNRGQTVVLTNGCFDLLHVGHVTSLQQAAALGDVLVVAINSDASVRRLKGPDRPVIGENDRAAMLAALACVDHVLIFDEDTPRNLLEQLRPDVLAKGGTTPEIVGREIVEAYGGRVCRTEMAPDVSTTQLLRQIDQRRSHPREPQLTSGAGFQPASGSPHSGCSYHHRTPESHAP